MSMLSKPNIKVGLNVWSWSIPAASTCPGRTPVCLSKCYARRGHFRMPTVQALYARNKRLAGTAGFADWCVHALRASFVRVLRIHVSGDFYSEAYIRKWIRIVQACPRIRFYAYTRSWRTAALRTPLWELAALPNMFLWLSCDKHSGRPPRLPRLRRPRLAYMSTTPVDWPPYLVDLAFRTYKTPAGKWTPGGSLICPYENGVSKGITCSTCRICFRKEAVPISPILRGQPCPGSITVAA